MLRFFIASLQMQRRSMMGTSGCTDARTSSLELRTADIDPCAFQLLAGLASCHPAPILARDFCLCGV